MADDITPEQSRGGRAMLGWTQAQLADAADLGKQTVVDFERGARVPHGRNLTAIRRALEEAGVLLLPNNGVRLEMRRLTAVDGPFYARWMPAPPSRQGEYQRSGAERLFEDLWAAIRFVMTDLPLETRATAWIDGAAGGSVSIDEIEHQFKAARK